MKSSPIHKSVSCLLILAIAMAAVLVSGCDDPNYVMPPYYSYWIKVDGLEQFYTDAGTACFAFPAPVYNGSEYLPFHDNVTTANSANVYPGRWNNTGLTGGDSAHPNADFHGTAGVRVANLDSGKMVVIGVQPTDYYMLTVWKPATPDPGLNATDPSPIPMVPATRYKIIKPAPAFDPLNVGLKCTLGPDKDTARPIIDSLTDRPFYPDLGLSDHRYTRWLIDSNVSNYTTYVYIDNSLKPKDTGNHNLDIRAIFSVVVGYHPWGSYRFDQDSIFVIDESIPGNVTGLVPVTVQCLGNMSDQDIYQVFGTSML